MHSPNSRTPASGYIDESLTCEHCDCAVGRGDRHAVRGREVSSCWDQITRRQSPVVDLLAEG